MRKELAKRYDKVAAAYSKAIYENFWNNILEYPTTSAEIKKLRLKGKKVLDAGCGSGRYTKLLVKAGAKVWGVDNSPKMLEIAKATVKGAEFSVGDACRTKFKKGSFDAAFSGLVLEYLDRNRFFKEMSRVLKNNGVLLLSMHVPYCELGERTGKQKLTFRFSNYFIERKYYMHWPRFKTRMCFRHATMQTTMRAILKNGFVIEDYIDIKPPAWSRKKFKRDYERVTRLPPFAIINLRKKRAF
jgi:ubiquinone/menaquinone biosynthesis C-methylase UbiE